MRVLVVDDEAPARGRLVRLLAAVPDVSVVGEAEDGEQAVERIASLEPQLVLLDIRMPRLNGFGLVHAMGDEMPLTVFCTAYDEYALQAFEARAIDYLLKPVQPERLAAALDRARLLLQRPRGERARGLRRVTDLVETELRYLPRLLVHDGGRAQLLPVEQIDRIRADRNHSDVHAGKKCFRVRRTLSSFAARLDPAAFLRINKSDIVRLDAIREIQPWSHGDYRVVMHDGTTLSWSRRFRAHEG
jgi:two-component system LytT family response regulator